MLWCALAVCLRASSVTLFCIHIQKGVKHSLLLPFSSPSSSVSDGVDVNATHVEKLQEM